MVTDKQFKDLLEKYEELNRKYTQMSRDIAAIKMTLDLKKTKKDIAPPQSRKDVTRYLFQGKQLNKRQLVLECIKQYITDTNITDATVLIELFPDHLQGSMGVIRAVEEAERYLNATEHYFFGDNDVLHLDTGLYVVSKDWTYKNIGQFIEVMETAGYSIKTISRD